MIFFEYFKVLGQFLRYNFYNFNVCLIPQVSVVKIMQNIKLSFAFICLLLSCLFCPLSYAQPFDNVLVTLDSLDPQEPSTLGNEDVLYVLVRYESERPLRFQAIAMRDGVPLEVGAIKNPPALHAPGNGEALVWVGYTNPTRVDSVSVTVMDVKWRKLFSLMKDVDVKWQGVASEKPRKPAEWVDILIRAEKRKMDYFYDPSPKKYGFFHDVVFFLTMISFPLYILLQLHMLWRYKYRWRELSMIPIFPYLILGFYMLVGLDIDESLRITFLFRYTPFAFLYLLALWLAKRFWQDKLPPPKLYKPPKA